MPIDKRKNTFIINNDFLNPAVIFLSALFLRLIYIYQYQSSPFFLNPVIDALSHFICARHIATEGDWLLKGFIIPRAPGYFYFLALVFKLFGVRIFLAKIIQAIIGAFSCVLIYWLGKKIFNRGIALVAGLICSFYGVLIYFDAEFLNVNLAIFFYLLLLILLLKAVECSSVFKWMGVGGLFGVCFQISANILSFLPFLLIWVFFYQNNFQVQAKAINKNVKKLLVLLCIGFGIILSLLPLTLRNLSQGGELVIVPSSVGINFYMANNAQADGKRVIAPSHDFAYSDKEYIQDNVIIASIKQAQRLTGKHLTAVQTSDFWLNQAIFSIQDNPLRFLSLIGKKAYYFLNGFEIPNNHSIYTFRSWSSLLKLSVFSRKLLVFPFGLLCPLALIGILVIPKKEKGVMLLISIILSHFLFMIIFFVCSRFRVVLVPFLALFAASGIYWFIFTFKNKHFKKLGVYIVIFIALFMISNSNFFNVREDDQSVWFLKIGAAYTNQGDKAKALKSYKYAQIINPKNADAIYNLAVMSLEEGNYDEATEKFRQVIFLRVEDSAAHNNLGLVFMKKSEFIQAIICFKRALEIDSQDMGAWVNLASAYIEQGKTPEALEILSKAKLINPNFPPLLNCFGILYEKQGQEDKALTFYQKALILNPDYIPAHYNLSLLYEKQKNKSQAQMHKARALDVLNKENPDFQANN
ncbi:MAG: tetratricopeptide repeat protein [Candidatus Omnitrophota bacterium]